MLHFLALQMLSFCLLNGYLSPPTRLFPIAGLQLLLDNHKLVLFEIAQYYHYKLEFVITNWFYYNSLDNIWTGYRPGKFLQSHDSTIELTHCWPFINDVLYCSLYSLEMLHLFNPEKYIFLSPPNLYDDFWLTCIFRLLLMVYL